MYLRIEADEISKCLTLLLLGLAIRPRDGEMHGEAGARGDGGKGVQAEQSHVALQEPADARPGQAEQRGEPGLGGALVEVPLKVRGDGLDQRRAQRPHAPGALRRCGAQAQGWRRERDWHDGSVSVKVTKSTA